MQVDPINPTLKAPGSKRLKLRNDEPFQNFAFKISLRRYIAAKLVEQGADVNAVGTDQNGYKSTPLWWAAKAVFEWRYSRWAGGLQLATLLVEKCADVNAAGSDGAGYKSTPLWWVVRAVARCQDGSAGAAELATLLVGAGADVTAAGSDGDGRESTPLWWAAKAVAHDRAGGLELSTLLVEKLVEQGRSGTVVNTVGTDFGVSCTPLRWAAMAVWRGTAGGMQLATLLVGRCRLTLSNPRCKRLELSA